ncbi:PaeR7I family type II restriction endonuclease [Rhodoferax sp. TBRC 17660]|uniref:PaeR7I family type II restriction endonuclease n=1 Tax=Rhodoferax potami TaxID=3068338 RepID=A0ABU3KNQ7_9BURK|nr:PaeR7I family type II restriction endonuclease [Rhodoferax sp. TBRC 17660]
MTWQGLAAAPASRKPIKDKSPHFPVFPDFVGASYLKRYDLLCQKLAKEQLYSSASVIATPRAAVADGAYVELSTMTGLRPFVASLAGHIAAEAAR